MEKIPHNKKVSWSVSITAVVALVFGAAVYSADGRYVLASRFVGEVQTALIHHELDKLRVELAILTERRNAGKLASKEKTELDIKESYRQDLLIRLRDMSR